MHQHVNHVKTYYILKVKRYCIHLCHLWHNYILHKAYINSKIIVHLSLSCFLFCFFSEMVWSLVVTFHLLFITPSILLFCALSQSQSSCFGSFPLPYLSVQLCLSVLCPVVYFLSFSYLLLLLPVFPSIIPSCLRVSIAAYYRRDHAWAEMACSGWSCDAVVSTCAPDLLILGAEVEDTSLSPACIMFQLSVLSINKSSKSIFLLSQKKQTKKTFVFFISTSWILCERGLWSACLFPWLSLRSSHQHHGRCMAFSSKTIISW